MSAERWRAQHERKHEEMERTIQSLRTWLAHLHDRLIAYDILPEDTEEWRE